MSALAILPIIQARAEFVPILKRIQAEREAAAPAEQATLAEPVAAAQPPARPAPRPQLAFYRKYTEAIVRRYMRMSMQVGRVPCLLNRGEMFRAKVSNYRMESFEDVVIFCHDIERRLQRLTSMQQCLIDLVAIKEYTMEEAAPIAGVCVKVAVRHYTSGLDRLTGMFIEAEILKLSALTSVRPSRSGSKCCQAPQPVQKSPCI
jgi:hypothetical protein